MGIQPQTLIASLQAATQSTDHTPPTAVIAAPASGSSFTAGQVVTITGTASDVGGKVAGIEVSTDGGATWNPATGTTNWSYSWAATGVGTHIIEARAIDDSVNMQLTPATLNVSVTGSPFASLFTATDTPAQINLNDGSQLELGMKFTSSWRARSPPSSSTAASGDTGTDIARSLVLDRHEARHRHLLQHHGERLADGEPDNAGRNYGRTRPTSRPYHTDRRLRRHRQLLHEQRSRAECLTAPSSTTSGGNGVYAYGGTSTTGLFPTSTFSAANYWVDVLFNSAAANTPPTAVADPGDATEKGGVANGSGGSPATGNVLTNDTDPDVGDTKTVTAVSFGATAGTLGSSLAGAHGSLVLAANGTYTYTINEIDPRCRPCGCPPTRSPMSSTTRCGIRQGPPRRRR